MHFSMIRQIDVCTHRLGSEHISLYKECIHRASQKISDKNSNFKMGNFAKQTIHDVDNSEQERHPNSV